MGTSKYQKEIATLFIPNDGGESERRLRDETEAILQEFLGEKMIQDFFEYKTPRVDQNVGEWRCLFSKDDTKSLTLYVAFGHNQTGACPEKITTIENNARFLWVKCPADWDSSEYCELLRGELFCRIKGHSTEARVRNELSKLSKQLGGSFSIVHLDREIAKQNRINLSFSFLSWDGYHVVHLRVRSLPDAGQPTVQDTTDFTVPAYDVLVSSTTSAADIKKRLEKIIHDEIFVGTRPT